MERRAPHKKNMRLEKLLEEVNSLLSPVEDKVIGSIKHNSYPILMIMGAPRSGTTLFLQWLASLGLFCYPTNILSRFYGAPYIGAKIQLMLTSHDFNNEIFDFNEVVQYTSRLGKTKGALAPNEFWYFWRRFFQFGEIQKMSEKELLSVNHKVFLSELSAIESIFDKPLVLKAMIANWHIPYLASVIDKVLFVYIKRNPLYTIQSLLHARNDYFGSIEGWYSFKPPEYAWLRKLSAIEQVCGQVYYTTKAIEDGLSTVDSARHMVVEYEDFCSHPCDVFDGIVAKFGQQGLVPSWKYAGPMSFACSNKITMSQAEIEKIMISYKKIAGVDIAL